MDHKGSGGRWRVTDAQAAILTRMAAVATLTHSLMGDGLWSLLEDPFPVSDDVSPRVLRDADLIALAARGSIKADCGDAYPDDRGGHEALNAWRANLE